MASENKKMTNLFISLRKKKEGGIKSCSEGKDMMNLKDKKEDNYFAQRRLRRGCDPRLQTCRGKLQNRRSKLNMEINKELMLLSGAENLYNATNNKRLKEAVALELHFFNSNLQLLKEQLAEMNSSVEIYQGGGSRSTIPMIPLGLKETKEIDFRDAFKDFILEHYSEEPSQYDVAITEFMELREAMRTPERDESGIDLLFDYFNQLYFIDRRFFPPDRSLGIFFEWYDSLTGSPSCQRTIAFEKACVLFNIGALYTQLGARHDRSSASGLDAAVNCFLRAAGMFQYLHETFTNAPSKDLNPEVLETLIQLMLAQARECLHEKILLSHKEDVETLLEISQEAAQVAADFLDVFNLMSLPTVKDYVPKSWVSLIHIKSEHYRGRAHFHIAEALLAFYPDGESNNNDAGFSQKARDLLMYIPDNTNSTTVVDIVVPKTRKERTLLGLSHGRESVIVHEEALRLHRMCRELKKKGSLIDILQLAHQAAVYLLEEFEVDDQLLQVLDPPPIAPSTKVHLSLAPPDFSQYKVEDIFKQLGPVSVFSAKHYWSAPRSITLTRTAKQGFGFSVRGDAPVIIAGVDRGGLAEKAGMQEGDILVTVSNQDVKWHPHEDVVSLIRQSGTTLNVSLVTPSYKSYPKLSKGKSKSLKDLSPNSTTSSSSGVSSTSSGSRRSERSNHYGSINSSSTKEKRASWNPFKRSLSKDKLLKIELHSDSNVILR